MAFKLPDNPSPRAHTHELADFAELLAWINGNCSARNVQSYLSHIDDNQDNVGIEDSDLEIENLTDGMIEEVGRRENSCPVGYPFSLDNTGSVLTFNEKGEEPRASIYLYLLMATRLNMQTDRTKNEIDGTALMEELSSQVLRSYLGPKRAFSLVFGTAANGKFCDKIEDLCKSVGEGGIFQHIDSGAVNANDDSLDVVGWIPFSDNMPCKLSVFGQCKTGTSWDHNMRDLQPDKFIKRWMSGSFVLDPVRAYFIAESANTAHWSGNSLYAGLFFDRCRIVDYSDNVDSDLLKRIRQWTKAAMSELEAASWGG